VRSGATPIAAAANASEPWHPPMPELAGARHRLVPTGEVRLHVAELGDEGGPPVLLVHGWPQSWWCWRHVAALLARDFRVVMADLRGHGWSEAPAGGYEKERLAADLVGLLEALELDRVGYVGHDWGAFIGYLISFAAPERVRALLTLSIPHPWPSRHDRLNPRRLAAFAYQLPLASPLGGAIARRELATRVLKAASAGAPFDERDLEVYESTMGSERGARTTVAMYRTFVLRELVPIARGRYAEARLEMPSRLLVGSRDPIVRGADLRGAERNAPRLEVERVPGAGHFLPEERPDLVADRARELLASAPP
jgi:pimeloyl-ACP methyl ester carboxylesterase